MDKKTKIFFGVLTIAIIISIFFTFNRAFVTKNYEIIPIPEEVIK